MKIRSTLWRALAIGLSVMASSDTVLAGAEFSAEMVRYGPQGRQVSTKMFVGDQRVRTEMSHQGQQIIHIADKDQGIEWVLFPDRKEYMEQRLLGTEGELPGTGATPAKDPCGGMPGLTCRRLGEEMIDGRKAVKWEIIATHHKQTMKSTQWIDKERGLPLRQELPDGGTMALKFVAVEELNGRRVEKWERVMTIPNRPEMRTFQWFDPELDLDVRQELPGGMVSELKSIRVGKQPGKLFTIPADYKPMTTP